MKQFLAHAAALAVTATVIGGAFFAIGHAPVNAPAPVQTQAAPPWWNAKHPVVACSDRRIFESADAINRGLQIIEIADAANQEMREPFCQMLPRDDEQPFFIVDRAPDNWLCVDGGFWDVSKPDPNKPPADPKASCMWLRAPVQHQ